MPLSERLQWATAIRIFSLAVAFFYYYLVAKKRTNTDLAVFLAFIFTGVLGSVVISYIEIKIVICQSRISFDNIGARLSNAYLFCYILFLFLYRYYIDACYHCFISAILGSILLGKWGCFVLGDTCFGVPTSLPWGISHNGLNPLLVASHPVPAYDSLFALCLLGLLLYAHMCRHLPIFLVVSIGLLFLSIYGFFIEFIRLNPPVYSIFSINQICYALLFLLCLSVLLMRVWRSTSQTG